MAVQQFGPTPVRAAFIVTQDTTNGGAATLGRYASAGAFATTTAARSTHEIRQVTNCGTTAVQVSYTVSGLRYVLCYLEPGERYDVPLFGRSGVGLQLGLFTLDFPAARKGWPAGNQLVIVRTYLDGKEAKVSTEKLISSTDFVADSNGVRFMNRGLNPVGVGDVLLQPGQEFEIRPEPGYVLKTPLRISFDDGTTGRSVDYAAVFAELPA